MQLPSAVGRDPSLPSPFTQGTSGSSGGSFDGNLAGDLNVGGSATIAGVLTVNGTLNANGDILVAPGNRLVLNSLAASGQNAIQLQAGGVPRWNIRRSGNPESGGDAGSDFVVEAWHDNGTLSDQPFFISRSPTGPIYLGSNGTRPIVVGVDPAGAELLRIGGAVRASQGFVVGSVDATLRQGTIGKLSNHGVVVLGITGATNDFVLMTPAAFNILANPTGTQDLVASGKLSLASTLTLTSYGTGGGVVSVGNADSAGAGFRYLKVPN